MRLSLVITILNEEQTIDKLLDALAKQTKKPDEIIFVDGGSIDKTLYLIKQWAKAKKNVLIFAKLGLTIAQGRNLGIKKASGDIIVHTDAGCIPHINWFEEITQPFDDSKVDVVSGFYKMTGDSFFQKCLASYLGVSLETVNPDTFLPSTRSMAFRKIIWRKVGGFSEKLERAGEDTLFNYSAKKLGATFYFQKKALVDWEIPRSFWNAVKKFYTYAKGDGQAGIWWNPQQRISTHNIRIFSIYSRYLIGLISILWAIEKNSFFWVPISFFIFYLIWAVKKNYSLVKTWRAFFWLPVIQIVSDFAVMAGFIKGFFSY